MQDAEHWSQPTKKTFGVRQTRSHALGGADFGASLASRYAVGGCGTGNSKVPLVKRPPDSKSSLVHKTS